MNHVAILKADRRAWPGLDCRSAESLEQAIGPVEVDPASDTFEATDAKNAAGGLPPVPWGNLKPIIYHNAQDLTPRARRAPGRRESRSAGLRFSEAAGDEGELVELKVEAEPGMTESSLAPDRAARAGSSFRERGAWMVEDASCDV